MAPQETASIDIDSLGDKRVNYFNALKYFVNARKESLEGDDGYIKWAR